MRMHYINLHFSYLLTCAKQLMSS